MPITNASDTRIIYIGNWETKESFAVAKNDYCKALLMFRGIGITFSVKGNVTASFDGAPDCDDTSFTGEYGIHTLFVTAMKGAELISFNAEEILDIDKHLTSQLLNEYKEIRSGREVGDGSGFKKIPYKAVMPTENAKIGGVLGEIFEKNIKRITKCYTLPYFLIANDNPKGKIIAGWADWLTGSNYGRMLVGASKAYRFSKNRELFEIINSLVDKIEKNMREDGYNNYYSEEESYAINYEPGSETPRSEVSNTERKNYDRTFWTWGLTEAAKAGSQKALILVRKMYSWLEKSGYAKNLLLGLNSTNAVMGSLLLADSAQGNKDDILFNKKYLDQKCVEEVFANKNPAAFSNYPGNRPHCYVLLILLSLSYEYRLTGEKHYLDALLGAWDIYRRYYKHIGGATAICESGGPYPPGSYYLEKGHNGETCGSVFWIWINEELSKLFPDDARFSSEIEEVLFNIAPGMFSGLNVRYHNRMQGKKDNGGAVGTCCEIMATHLSADLPKYVCSYNSKTVYVNQFVSGDFKVGSMSVKTNADILEKGTFTLTVIKASKAKKTLKIRIPSWAKKLKFYLNEKRVMPLYDSDYTVFNRIFQKGDTITVSFSPEYKFSRYTGAEQLDTNEPRYALSVGPYLMGLIGTEEKVPCLDATPEELKIRKSKNSVYIKVDDEMKFIPYYEIGNNVNFCVFPAFKK